MLENSIFFGNCQDLIPIGLDGSNLVNNNVNTVSLARTYWGIPSSSFEIGGNTTLPRSAYGLRGSGVVLTPISQDSDGIPQYVLARLTVLLHC